MKSLLLLNTASVGVTSKILLVFLAQNITAASFIKNPEELKKMLVDKYNLDEQLVDAVLNSDLNFTMVVAKLAECLQDQQLKSELSRLHCYRLGT